MLVGGLSTIENWVPADRRGCTDINRGNELTLNGTGKRTRSAGFLQTLKSTRRQPGERNKKEVGQYKLIKIAVMLKVYDIKPKIKTRASF